MRFLAIGMLLLAGSATAEALVSTRSGSWNGVAGGSVTWAGGALNADDDFTIASSSTAARSGWRAAGA